MTVRYAIIENEELSSVNLRKQIQRLRPDWIPVFTAETVEECVDFFSADRTGEVDIIFMDIELDDGNCFDIFRQLASLRGDTRMFDIPVVFTTSYNQYAIKAFQVNSIDYLLKPIQDDDLQRAVEKWERTSGRQRRPALDMERMLGAFASWLSAEREPVIAGIAGDAVILTPQGNVARRILISCGDNYLSVATDDVAFFLAEEKVVYAVMKGSGRRYVTGFASLQEVAPALPKDDFFQVSRGAVANIDAVERVSKYFKGRLLVTLRAGDTTLKVTVTAARKQEFLSWYGFNS